jgi:hypothetical protein
MTQTARTRIRRFKMHGSGLWVVVLHQPEEMTRGEEVARRAAELCSYHTRPLAGFALVVWDDKEASSCDWDIWVTRIPNVLLPEFVKERVRREILVDATVERLNDD